MTFYVYNIYDPETEAFATNFGVHPLGIEDMKEQYRRSWVKANEKDKAFLLGKVAVCLGVFDDTTGKIDQSKFIEVFRFKDIEVKSEDKGESEGQADA